MKQLMFVVASLFFAAQAGAADVAEVEKRIRASLTMLLPNLSVDAVAETPMLDLYEVTLGNRIVYVSGNGRFLLQGKVIDLETREPLTDQRLQALKASALKKLDEKDMVIYGDKDAEHTVTVFTDIDCGFCRKLHSEMDAYVDAGIRIRYLAYPRAGLGSPSAKDAESVWCADDKPAAMTAAKIGGKIDAKTCDSPIAEHYELGKSFGIRGTPALVMDDGEVIPGYVPAKRLKAALDQRKKLAN